MGLGAASTGWDVTVVGRTGLTAHGAVGSDGTLESRLSSLRVLRWPMPAPLRPGLLPLVPQVYDLAVRPVSYPDPEAADLAARRLELVRRRHTAHRGDSVGSVLEVADRARGALHRRRQTGLQAGVRDRAARSRRVVELALECGLELEWGRRLEPLVLQADVLWVMGDRLLPPAVTALSAVGGRRPRLVYDVLSDLTPPGAGLRARLRGSDERSRAERRLAAAADVLVTSGPEGERAARSRFGAGVDVRVVPDPGVPSATTTRRPAPALASLPPDSQPLVVLDPHRPGSVRSLRPLVGELPHLPEARLVVVANQGAPGMRDLRELARRTGVDDRFHWVDEAPDAWLTTDLARAAVGIVPSGDPLEDRVRVPGAYRRLLRDGVPVLAQRSEPTVRAVRDDASGAVTDLGNAAAVREAVRSLLRYRPLLAARLAADAHTDPGTSAVASLLEGVETASTSRARASSEPAVVTDPPAEVRVTPVPKVLGVGPANFAGQGWAWAKAVERVVPGLRTEVFASHQGALTFPSDRVYTRSQTRSLDWQLAEQRHVLSAYTHLLAEANRSLFGTLLGDDAREDLRVVRRHGIVVGLALHGSEVRNPDRHAAMEEFSPFAQQTPQAAEYRKRAGDLVAMTERLLAEFDGPVFVSTPDLLVDVPHGIWLPVVVDLERPQGEPPLTHGGPPVVVHAPSRAYAKGTALIEPVVTELAEQGLIEYRRLRGVPPEQMPAMIAGADIVLDQFALGSYGALACEAMVAGRVVVGNVNAQVREKVGQDLPIVQATPRDLREVLLGLAEEPARARDVAARGRQFVADVHSGDRSGTALRDHLIASSD